MNIVRDTSQKNPPYLMLDAWRGIAALWVVMIHACLATIANESPELAHEPLYAFSLYGQMGVTIFFIISGYCITASAVSSLTRGKSSLDFLRARIRRIYPPYFSSMVVIFLFTQLTSFLALRHIIPVANHQIIFSGKSFYFYFSHLTITQTMFGIKPISIVYWSLCYEVAFYVIIVFFMLFSRKEFCRNLNFFTLVALAWLCIAPQSCSFPFDLWPMFGFGALVYFLIVNSSEKWNKIFYIFSVSLMVILIAFRPGEGSLGHPSSRYNNILCLIFSATLILFHRWDGKIANSKMFLVLSCLGKISYSLYLSHAIFMPVTNQIARRMHFTGEWYWISFFIQIGTSIPIAYIFYIMFERPFINAR